MTDEPIEGTATEIEAYEPAAVNLFRTDTPVEVLAQATLVADALKGVIQKQRLFKNISGRDHVLVEGWTTLGSMRLAKRCGSGVGSRWQYWMI
jgi:hypothetical protein